MLEWRDLVLGVVLGVGVVVVQLAIFAAAGWIETSRDGKLPAGVLVALLATVVLKVLWAALEELVFRGAVLAQLTRLRVPRLGLVASALLFAFAHLSRSGDRAPTLASLTVLAADGLGFGIACLATRSLWMPTAWHAAKNLSVWLLLGQGTMQLAEGPLAARFVGPTFWVGAPQQAGAVDVGAAVAAVLVVLAVYRGRIGPGLAWVAARRAWAAVRTPDRA
jgi:membrane protease YdiL (CAAX protease family)